MVEVPSDSSNKLLQDRFNQTLALALQKLLDQIKLLEERVYELEQST